MLFAGKAKDLLEAGGLYGVMVYTMFMVSMACLDFARPPRGVQMD